MKIVSTILFEWFAFIFINFLIFIFIYLFIFFFLSSSANFFWQIVTSLCSAFCTLWSSLQSFDATTSFWCDNFLRTFFCFFFFFFFFFVLCRFFLFFISFISNLFFTKEFYLLILLSLSRLLTSNNCRK